MKFMKNKAKLREITPDWGMLQELYEERAVLKGEIVNVRRSRGGHYFVKSRLGTIPVLIKDSDFITPVEVLKALKVISFMGDTELDNEDLYDLVNCPDYHSIATCKGNEIFFRITEIKKIPRDTGGYSFVVIASCKETIQEYVKLYRSMTKFGGKYNACA